MADIQTPTNPIEWENRLSVLRDIPVGTPVWIGAGQYPCSRGIKTVIRLTNTLVIVGPSQWDRYKKDGGYQMGKPGSIFTQYISGIASPEEIAKFQADKQHAQDVAERKLAQEKATQTTQDRLNALFKSESDYIYVNHVSKGEEFSLNITGLTEEQVEKMAPEILKTMRSNHR